MRTACDRSGANGNGASSRGTRRTDNARGQLETRRFLCWTEDVAAQSESRASSLAMPRCSNVTERKHHYAGTDLCASREQSQACLSYAEMEQRRRSQRRLKLVGVNSSVDVNAEYMTAVSTLNEPTLYPSAYMVLTNKGYTKHYYAGTERVCAKIGGGFGVPITSFDPDEAAVADSLFNKTQSNVTSQSYPVNNVNEINTSLLELSIPIMGNPTRLNASVHTELTPIHDVVEFEESRWDSEDEVFYYHSDHLGSASWITDGLGVTVQHLQYLPFGEPFVNQRAAGSLYDERFTFTGKERDEETGFSYFGARYMDHELMTMWLSVDPMADKYPSMSPYHYCHWNPIVMVDYDGRWDIKVTAYKDRGKCAYATFVVYDKNQNEIYRTIVKVQGTSHKKNDYKPRDRHKKNADTPTGKYKIKMWKKMSPSVSYGPNPALILEYEGGECTPQERNDIHVHGGRQEGEYKGRQYLSSTYGCFRIKDEDLVELKKIVDGLVDDPMGMLILEDGMSDDMANDINKQLPTLMTDHQKRTTYGNEPDSLIPFLEEIYQLFDSHPLSVPDATRVEIKYIPNQF